MQHKLSKISRFSSLSQCCLLIYWPSSQHGKTFSGFDKLESVNSGITLQACEEVLFFSVVISSVWSKFSQNYCGTSLKTVVNCVCRGTVTNRFQFYFVKECNLASVNVILYDGYLDFIENWKVPSVHRIFCTWPPVCWECLLEASLSCSWAGIETFGGPQRYTVGFTLVLLVQWVLKNHVFGVILVMSCIGK